ncbi:hypothetical protein I215_02258 [Galbibacter marinus]|uniref:Uncharacterized protein n=1 Tax=Galbibacter marinus TaxID=555500 RepID=K2P5S4_9FLAO|nr:hypothetical protein [Galbibacter marinus]EKF56308.1 hypothetical protein I215_02258 [Galbibacter marinus]
MKKSKLIVLLAILSSSLLMANVDPNPSTKEISKQLSSILGTPNFKLNENVLVANVRFKVNAESEIVVLTVKSENELVESYIKGRMNYKKVDVPGLIAGKEYTVDVRILSR